MNVVYEPHPVTPERKAELRAAGYKIIDAAFAPSGDTPPEPKSSTEPAVESTNKTAGRLGKGGA